MIALLLSWLPVTICIVAFRRELFRPDPPPLWCAVAGTVLVILEVWLFSRLAVDLGAARLVGQTELSGAGAIVEQGIYARVRHPRYSASFLAIVGACLMAGTRAMCVAAAAWVALMWVVIGLEERELRRRFGSAYEGYADRVPRFIPRLRA